MEYVDLRSDTVSHPTPSMREAMANAAVGDDVYGEDPTVNRLQEMSADLLGKEAGLFIPSGTMGNLVAILAHCGRGDEVIVGNKAHIFLYEAGGISALGGVHSHQLKNQPDGTLALEDIKGAIRPDDPHDPITRLVTLENTQNQCGGIPLSVDYTQAVGTLVKEHSLKYHLDGARIFNAAAALGVEPRDLCAPVDSVTFCLSKGLCAPVGSVLCGSKDFILRAHRARKQLGGGMRQAGILAAAGIVALEEIIPRLEEDHQRAKRLVDGLKEMSWIELDPGSPYTNMIFFNLVEDFPITGAQVSEQLAEHGVLIGDVSERRFRLVTHYWITDKAVEKALSVFNRLGNV